MHTKNAINKAHQLAGFVRVVLTNSLSVTTRLGDATAIRQQKPSFYKGILPMLVF